MKKKIINSALMVAACIVINVIFGFIANKLSLPLWLDMMGTFIATYFTGIVGGLITGISTNLALTLLFGNLFLYVINSISAVFVYYIFKKKGFADNLAKGAVSSFWLGILCVAISTPINIIFNDYYSGNIWGDALYDMLRWYESPKVVAAIAGEAVVEIIDKQICTLVAFFAIKVIKNIKNKKEAGNTAVKALAALIAATSVLSLSFKPIVAYAAENDAFPIYIDNFVEKTYNNTNGMMSSEANTVGETDDGYIWIGSYAGLTRYDGTNFEFVRQGGLVSVISMFNDSKGRFWIGTNDAGFTVYENGKYSYYTTSDGLPVNSVRCFAEDKNGNMYIGTTGEICRFTTDGKIEVLNLEINFVKSLVMYNDLLVALDNNGSVYVIDGEKVITVSDELKNYFFDCIDITSEGLTVGSDSGKIFVLDISGNKLIKKSEIKIEAESITAIYQDRDERIWVANESQLGYLDKNKEFHKITNTDSSISKIHEDYQGNIWIASTRNGVTKLSESKVINVFEKVGMEGSTVNCVEIYNGDYYCGTDKGVVIIDEKTLKTKTNALTKLTDGERVRCIYKDSKNKLWVCTYSDNGLICYNGDNDIITFNTENSGTTGNRFRCVTELSDGRIAAGTTDGLNIIENGKLVLKISKEDGLENTQILSVKEGVDGRIWIGTDGAGIYMLTDGKLIKHIGVKDGLSSDVILRIVPYKDGTFVVTSNSLCYVDRFANARRLVNFPYFNNYDVIIDGETAYIPCSAGLYKSDIRDLIEDKDKQYRLYSANDGLVSGLTANSWNYISDDGNLFLCSNSGLIMFVTNEDRTSDSFRYGVTSVEFGDEVYTNCDEDNTYNVSEHTRHISVRASVRNYSFSDIKVRFFEEGVEEIPKTYYWNAIDAITISDMSIPEHIIHLQLLDSSDESVLSEKIYKIKRATQLWEKPIYTVYLTLVCLEIFVFTIVSIVSMILFSKRKGELENLQIILEQKVKDQTREINSQQEKTEQLFLQTVSALSGAVDAKDRYTSGHSQRVAEYAKMIAERMGKSKQEQEEIFRAGLLHDVGKIRVPGEIINKAGKLTDEEYDLIKIHPVTGYHILKNISGSEVIAAGAKFHHERYDGKGYPNGIAGENIPEVARILGVADSYDAMASNRSYRSALPQEVVRNEIVKGRGTQFDPDVADIMLQIMDEDTEYSMKQTDDLTKNILVVDDEPIYIKMITRILKDEPMYEIESASSGSAALELLAKDNKYDLILLDLKMPDMDGMEVLEKIRENYQTRVVFMTGDRNIETINRASELGCDDYITKPFQPLLLKEVIHSTGKE